MINLNNIIKYIKLKFKLIYIYHRLQEHQHHQHPFYHLFIYKNIINYINHNLILIKLKFYNNYY